MSLQSLRSFLFYQVNEYAEFLSSQITEMFEKYPMILVFQRLSVPKYTYKEQYAVFKRLGFDIERHHSGLVK